MKRYMNFAIIYAILAMAGGVFYRELTKYIGFAGKTTLSVVHTHYFVLGMIFFLVMMILEKNFRFTGAKISRIFIAYHVGLNLTCLMFIARGLTQAFEMELSSAVNASISGIAGIAHIILGVSIVLLLLNIKKSVTGDIK